MKFNFKFEVSLNAGIKKLRGKGAVDIEFKKEDMSKGVESDFGVNTKVKTEGMESSVAARGYLGRLISCCLTIYRFLASLFTHLNSLIAQLDRLIKQCAAVATVIVLMVNVTGGSLLGSSPVEIMQWLSSLPNANQYR
jgi:hypothetical protein